MQEIYLDNAATTKPLEELRDVYTQYATQHWQNPSALYAPAVQAQQLLRQSAQQLLHAFGSAQHKCIFTGSGTEGANTVILRGARNKKNMNYVTNMAEHPCVAESFRLLEDQGAEVRYIKPGTSGQISPQAAAELVDENTALVSIMHVSNETGAKNDICAIAAAVKTKNPHTLFHADGVQAYMREPIANASVIDYYTVSAHKLHAHKGTGAIFYLPGSPLKPLLPGGGQEDGLRSGTQNTLGILSFAKAVELLHPHRNEHAKHLLSLRRALLAELSGLDDMHMLSPTADGEFCAHILNLSFAGVAGETLLHTLEAAGIYIATGSACSSKKGRSRIAQALGLPDDVAAGSVRISFSIFNTMDEMEVTAREIKKNVAMLRKFKRV